MHNDEKSCCGGNGGTRESVVVALALVRMGVGLFFLAFGALKLFAMGPAGTAMLMTKVLGVTGTTAAAVAWLVIVAEFLGGIIVIAGSKVPHALYHTALTGFAVITIVGYFSAFGGDIKQFFWHAQLLLMIGALFAARPRCPMGVTGSCCP